MKVLAFLQKPYDLLAALEYLHQAGEQHTELTAVVVGNHANARSVCRLCQERNIPVIAVPEPDLYARAVSYLHARWIRFRRSLLVIKALLLPIAYVDWFRAVHAAKRKMRGLAPDLVLSDAWRSKCVYWSNLPGSPAVVLLDGGYSTIHYALLPAFGAGGARALVLRSLSQQRPRMPTLLIRAIVARTPASAAFFSCYTSPDSGPIAGLLRNDFSLSRSTFGQKVVDSSALILGQPRLKCAETYLARALAELGELGLPATTANIEYRFHPTDLNRSMLDADYRQTNEAGVTRMGMRFSYPTSSLEFDFLALDRLPSLIVCYESSSLIWQRAVLGATVRIVVLKDR